jgi:GrpB-like predicted nucleotidyltransferase (UPF0157 family)
MTVAEVHLETYDTAWPSKFELERTALLNLIGNWLAGPIEHVGSTAVAGLAAKPVIDIMAGVYSLTASEPAKEILVKHGYCYAPYKPEAMHWFCKPSPQMRTHHLHLIPFGSPLWWQRLAFRDALRSRPELALEYQQLKFELATRFRHDREAYTEAKAPFIHRVLSGLPTLEVAT